MIKHLSMEQFLYRQSGSIEGCLRAEFYNVCFEKTEYTKTVALSLPTPSTLSGEDE